MSIHTVEGQKGLYVRQSTGLVREVSPWSALTFNVLTSVPGFGLAYSVFYLLATYPGGHILSAFWITGAVSLAIALPFVLLTMTMPRSGGDYILVSRSIHPAAGLASSLTLFGAVALAEGFFGTAFVSVALVPCLSAIGLVSGHVGWINAANAISHKGWTFGLAVLINAVGMGMWALRLRRGMRLGITMFFVALGCMMVAMIVMFSISQATFVAHFNQIAGTQAYAKLLAAAHTAGVARPGTSWANTVPYIAPLAGLLAFSWWSANYAGEIRQARTWRTAVAMTVSLGIVVTIYTVFSIAVFHVAGANFVTAGNALSGTKSYPLNVAPFWVVIVGIATKNTIFTAFIAFTFLLWVPLAIWQNAAQPVRALFAWAFDGVLPGRVAAIGKNNGVPYVALAITFVAAVITSAWATFSSNFITVLGTTTFMLFVPMIFVSLSALLLPLLKPELWKRAPLPGKTLGIPTISIFGFVGLVASSFLVWTYVHYAALGLNLRDTLIALAIMLGAGVVLYFVARAVQRSKKGVDISLNYAEIPPE